MVKNFTRPVDVRDGSYWETVDSIELNWIKKRIEYILIPEDIIKKRICCLAKQITADFQQSDALVIVTVLQGAQKFAAELAYLIDNENVEFDSVRISSYIDDRSSGAGETTMILKNDVTGKDLLIVEDIVDTGMQMQGFMEWVSTSMNPRSVRLVTLMDKPSRREVDLKIDYCGFIIPDEFVVGYGLDFNEKYRNLPFVAVLKEEYTLERD
jgi:hypoxanthine phosphoribosyltransferase